MGLVGRCRNIKSGFVPPSLFFFFFFMGKEDKNHFFDFLCFVKQLLSFCVSSHFESERVPRRSCKADSFPCAVSQKTPTRCASLPSSTSSPLHERSPHLPFQFPAALQDNGELHQRTTRAKKKKKEKNSLTIFIQRCLDNSSPFSALVTEAPFFQVSFRGRKRHRDSKCLLRARSILQLRKYKGVKTAFYTLMSNPCYRLNRSFLTVL